MIILPDEKICNNLPEQVAKNAKDILEVAQQWDPYKEELEADFETLAAYLADMSSAAVGAIAGQDIAPANVAATASVSAPSITGDSIIEIMDGYTYTPQTPTTFTLTIAYAGVVKTGNKVTFALALEFTTINTSSGYQSIGYFDVPNAVGNKIIPTTVFGTNVVDCKKVGCAESVTSLTDANVLMSKATGNPGKTRFYMGLHHPNIAAGKSVFCRYEVTFLLSDNLAA